MFDKISYDVGESAGGKKLIYLVTEVDCISIANILIPVRTIQKKILTFLRPEKDWYKPSSNKADIRHLPRNFLGNKKEALTNLWLLMRRNYNDIRIEFEYLVRIKKSFHGEGEKEFHQLIPFLNSATTKFYLNYSVFLAEQFFIN